MNEVLQKIASEPNKIFDYLYKDNIFYISYDCIGINNSICIKMNSNTSQQIVAEIIMSILNILSNCNYFENNPELKYFVEYSENDKVLVEGHAIFDNNVEIYVYKNHLSVYININNIYTINGSR